MAALHGRLTIEALQQLGHTAIVIRNLVDGDVYKPTRILVANNHLAQLDGRGHQTDREVLVSRLPIPDLNPAGLITQVRYAYRFLVSIELQGKHTIFIGHYRHAPCSDTRLPQDLTRLVVDDRSAHYHLLGKHGQRDQHHP